MQNRTEKAGGILKTGFENERRIPVVWGVDKKYVLQAFVVMRSILLHSNEKYDFFIVTADDIDKEVGELTKILREEYDNFSVCVKSIDFEYLEEARIYNMHLSKAAYFRLFISNVLLEYAKCIYLDCDLIVHGNLKELYEIELEDCYLAGVKDCHIIADTPREREHQRILGIPSREKYINSGVMIMNLSKMRQDKIELCFMEQLKRENWYEDQDVLNVCCYPYIKILPLKYNLFHFYLGNNMKWLSELPYNRHDFEFDHKYPYILHMGGKYKGWVDFRLKGSGEWWQIAKVFSSCESYQYYRSKCQENCKEDKISDLISRAKTSRRIIIWGYSRNGKRLCELLLEYQLDNINAFVDNNNAVWGETYQGIPVNGFSSVNRGKDDVLWIVSCQQSYAEVIGQLKEHGIKEKNIIRYRELFTDIQYLRLLHESTYDSMVSELAKREYVRKIPDRNDREQYIRQIMNNPSQYDMEYTYLAEKYNFNYWFETWRRGRINNEDNSYYGLPKQRKHD